MAREVHMKESLLTDEGNEISCNSKIGKIIVLLNEKQKEKNELKGPPKTTIGNPM